MNFLDDETDELDYEKIIRTILDGDVTNISLITSNGKFYAIDADNNSCHG